MSQKYIDTHPHIISNDPQRHPLAPLTGEQSTWSRDRPVTYEQMLVEMDKAGIERSILVQASTCYGHDNSYVAQAVKAHGDRFKGVFSVDMVAPDALAAIDRWVDAGLSGMRVFIAGHTTSHESTRLDDPRAYPAWQRAADLGLPVCVQIRENGLGQLITLLEAFPAVRVVLDHFARPQLSEGAPYAAAASLFALARFPNISFKFTTHNVRESAQGQSTQHDFLRKAIDTFGASRIAWGSNFPASPGGLDQLLQEAIEATALLTADEKHQIFYATASRLYV